MTHPISEHRHKTLNNVNKSHYGDWMNENVPFFSSLPTASPMDYEEQLSNGNESRNPYKRQLGHKIYLLLKVAHIFI